MRWFENLLSRGEFLSAAWLSVTVAVLATVISLTIGLFAAYALFRFDFWGRAALEALFMTPLIFPAIALALSLAMVMSTVGLLRDFWGLLVAHVLITMPYAIRTIGASLREISVAIEDAALTLGARPAQLFWHVMLPLLRPGIAAGAVFSFIISMDEFTVSLFLTGPGLTTLPIEIFNYAEFNSDPTIASISVILILISCIAVAIIERLIGLRRVLS
jgi:putative spermidine/putrescine transport system permease protein